jgi:hypothetical protein
MRATLKLIRLLLVLLLSFTQSNAQIFLLRDTEPFSLWYWNTVEADEHSFLVQGAKDSLTTTKQFRWIDKKTGIEQKSLRFNYSDTTKHLFFFRMVKYNDLFIGAGIDPKD